MSDASLTNLERVQPRGPKIFLGLLALTGVAAAGWWMTRPAGPVGTSEDPASLLVVGPDADALAGTLGELGFVAEHGGYDALAAEGAALDGDRRGIEAIVHLADVRGIGYVALQDPARPELASITVTADSAELVADHRWAVFSVGELGMPPRVTVDPGPGPIPLPEYVPLLRALFGQPRLASTLFSESRLPIDAAPLHRRIKPAVDLHGAYAMLDRRVERELRARTEALESTEHAEPAPTVLARPMESTEVMALADGTVLSFVQGWRLDSPRDPEVSLQPSTEIELWYHPPGSTDPAARERCDSLRGGRLAIGETTRVLSHAGDALMLARPEAMELWTLDVDAGACAFTRRGKIPRTGDDESGAGVPNKAGRVLRPARAAEGLALNLWTPGRALPETLPMPGCTELGAPAWLDEEHFAVSCRFRPRHTVAFYEDVYGEPPPDEVVGPPPQTWIYVGRTTDARLLAVPGTRLDDGLDLHVIRPVPGSAQLDLLLDRPWSDRLYRLQAPDGPAALFRDASARFAAADASAARPPSRPPLRTAEAPDPSAPLERPPFVAPTAPVVALAGDELRVSTIELPDRRSPPSISPDGRRLAYVGEDGRTLYVASVEGGAPTTLAKNDQATIAGPRFTADGRAVVFTRAYEGADRSETVGQRVSLAGEGSSPPRVP